MEPFVGWIIKEELGEGGFGKVYKSEKDGYCSAIKQIIVPNDMMYKSAEVKLKSSEEIIKYYEPIINKMKSNFSSQVFIVIKV